MHAWLVVVFVLLFDMSSDFHTTSSLFDSIHGNIQVPVYLWNVIDTPTFQRLRYLKQLGVTNYVFPGATHTRFEHSIGVSYLTGKLINRIAITQPSLEISTRDMELVQLAGLCHDLGHGPFSHAFEVWVNERRKADGVEEKWSHEEMSCRLLNQIADTHALEYSHKELRFVTDLIKGEPSGNLRFLFDVVNNKRNGVDLDKFDYIARDCHHLGLKYTFDPSSLMENCKVIQNEVCYLASEVYNVYELFHTRYSLFKKFYSHNTSKAIEYMFMDALTEVNSCSQPGSNWKISAMVDDVEQYLQLNDSIIQRIEWSTEPEFRHARHILQRVRRRELYCLADQLIVSPEHWPLLANVTANDIVSCQSQATLHVSDLLIHCYKLNYGMAQQNPVNSVHFYSARRSLQKPILTSTRDTQVHRRGSCAEKFCINKEAVSLLIPDQFCEHMLRVYCRDSSKAASAQAAFRRFLARRVSGSFAEQRLVRGHTLLDLKAYHSDQKDILAGKRKRLSGKLD